MERKDEINYYNVEEESQTRRKEDCLGVCKLVNNETFKNAHLPKTGATSAHREGSVGT